MPPLRLRICLRTPLLACFRVPLRLRARLGCCRVSFRVRLRLRHRFQLRRRLRVRHGLHFFFILLAMTLSVRPSRREQDISKTI